LFDCAGEPLVGIVSLPAERPPAETAVLVVVGGPQYRAGAHRQFVSLARALASAGHAVLRFDVRGMGDSGGPRRDFENLSDDIGCALDAFAAALPGVRRFVLFGLCDGASAALLYLHDRRDARVEGLCLLNPWARSAATLARTHLKHYYLQRLRDPAFWRKVAAGGVGWERVREFARSLRAGAARPRGSARTAARPSFQQAMASAWRRFDGRILLALSSDDLTAREFVEHASSAPEWRGLLEGARVRRLELAGADHTLSEPKAQAAFEDAFGRWLGGAAWVAGETS